MTSNSVSHTEKGEAGEQSIRQAPWLSTNEDEVDRVKNASKQPSHNVEALEAQLEHTVSARKAIFSGRKRASPSAWIEPGPPPDGGSLAWTQAVMAHLTLFSSFGYIVSFGVFQTYYKSVLDVSASSISWLGSVQIFLLFFVGTFSGRAVDAGLFHHVYIAGCLLQLLGIFTTSAAKTYWQLFLSQALCSGLSSGLQFTPAMSLVTTYFAKKRALALGVVALGSCTGGIVYPLVVQQLLSRIGFPWTIRVIGFIMLLTCIITVTCYRTRLPPRQAGPLVEWSAFKEAPYSLLSAAMFFNFWGLYFAFFYVGSYGRDILGLSYQDSINLLITITSTGFVFRLLPNYIADRIGPLNSIIPFAFLASLMVYVWEAVHTMATLFIFATVYGISSAGIQSLYPPTLSSLTTDLSRAGVRMGMGFSIVSVASLTGPPLAGALIEKGGGKYLYAQIWGGTSFLIGACLLLATRFASVGWKLKARI